MGFGASVSMFVLFSVTGTPARPTIAVVALLGVVAGEAVRQALPRH
jgi:xanthosine utilization system XapX-like protein